MTASYESLRCPGMHDLAPEDMARFRHVEQLFRTTCEHWGFREIRTPIIEHLHLFTSAGTLSPQMLGRVYSFLDWDGWSGERVVLRPDGTIPAARLYWERYRGEVAKLFYVENLFRFAPSEHRREIWQCGAELIGDTWPLGDLEVIGAVSSVLRGLGFENPTLRLSHTGIIRAILATAGYTPEEQLALYDRLIEGDLGVFGEIERRLPQAGAPIRMLMDMTGGRVDGLENLRGAFAVSLPRIVQPLDELRTIAATLAAAGCPYELDLTIVRGFEYYTGPVFQLLIDGENIAGGGRYDGLVASQEGHSVPACGFAISVDPLLDLLPADGRQTLPELIEVYSRTDSPESRAAALRTVIELHERGHGAELIAAGKRPPRRPRLSVDAGGDRTRYHLENRSGGAGFAIESLAEVLAVLGAGGRA